jgi:hypothetical protein
LLKKYVAALALALPLAAQAGQEIGVCGQSVTSFFAPLLQQRLIAKTPFKVSESSVNHFKANLFANMSAYGMPVISVFGYSDNPLFFVKRGEPSQDVYGVIVKEGLANTQAQLASVGAVDARAFRVDSRSTLILCKGEMQ